MLLFCKHFLISVISQLVLGGIIWIFSTPWAYLYWFALITGPWFFVAVFFGIIGMINENSEDQNQMQCAFDEMNRTNAEKAAQFDEINKKEIQNEKA